MATWKEPKNNYTPESQVVPEIFNTLAENERYLNETKITTSQVQDAAVTSTEATTRTNIVSGDTIKVAFGKLRKWFADLGALAFKSIINSEDIAAQAITQGKIASHAVTYGKIEGGAVITSKLADLAVTAEKIADAAITTAKILNGAVTDAKIESVSASKVTGLAKVATSGSYNDLSDKPSIPSGSSGVTFSKISFNFNQQYNIPATGIYLAFVKFTYSGNVTIACVGLMSNSTTVTNGSYSGVAQINQGGSLLNVCVWVERVSSTALKYHLRVSSNATTMPNSDYSGSGSAELICYKIGGYAAIS